LQRLFSTFPNGGPGAALLLLRFAAGGFLIVGEVFIPGLFAPAIHGAFVLLGCTLVLGLWTPVTATVAAVLEGLSALSSKGDPSTQFLMMVLTISLALLGPGAWSLDARVFGRKRIDI
jgi:putative oxidoreductase